MRSVDGTSGFIRHQQYAVCLALIVNGQVELGVIGCPNLGPEPAKIGEEIMPNGAGVVMIAIKGEGSYSVRHIAQFEIVWMTDPLCSDPSTRTPTPSCLCHLLPRTAIH